MAILAAARRASSLVLLRASCALLRPLASPATAIRSSSASFIDSARFALLKAASDSSHAETGSRASAAAVNSLRAAADSFGSTTYNDLLVRDIDYVIKSPRLTKMKETEAFFPFEISDNNLGSKDFDITLRRTFEDEQINIRAHTIHPLWDKERVRLTVTVSKSNGSELKFYCAVCANYFLMNITGHITILSMNMTGQFLSEDMSNYNDFHKLDRNLQKSVYKYLELRGVTPIMVKLLHEYKRGGGPRTQHFWLNKLSDFIKKD